MGRGRPRAFDPATVLERAMEVFWQRGYDAVGIAELCAHAGIARQSLYGTFGDKRALYLRAVEHYARTRLRPIRDRLTAGPPWVPAVRAVVYRWVEAAGRERAPGCMIGAGIVTWATRDPEVARILSGHLDELESWFEAALERARLAGELPDDARTRDLAALLAMTGQALALRSRSGPDRERAARVARTVLGLLSSTKRGDSNSGSIDQKTGAPGTRLDGITRASTRTLP